MLHCESQNDSSMHLALMADASPQPFKVSMLAVGEEPKSSVQIYADSQGFLANVLVEVIFCLRKKSNTDYMRLCQRIYTLRTSYSTR